MLAAKLFFWANPTNIFFYLFSPLYIYLLNYYSFWTRCIVDKADRLTLQDNLDIKSRVAPNVRENQMGKAPSPINLLLTFISNRHHFFCIDKKQAPAFGWGCHPSHSLKIHLSLLLYYYYMYIYILLYYTIRLRSVRYQTR